MKEGARLRKSKGMLGESMHGKELQEATRVEGNRAPLGEGARAKFGRKHMLEVKGGRRVQVREAENEVGCQAQRSCCGTCPSRRP